MKNTSKILALVLVVMTVLMSLSAITASAAPEKVIKTFEASELVDSMTVDAETTQVITAGTDSFFTINMSKSKLQTESKKTYEDGYAPSYRLSLNGNSKVEKGTVTRSVSFTTESAATVKVWWRSGKNDRTMELYNSELSKIEETDKSTKDDIYVAEFVLDKAGTYYIAHSTGTNYIYKIEVSWEVETCDHTGGTATCKDLAVCELCEQPYGALSTEHDFVDGVCTVCEAEDPDACKHETKDPATCLLPETCVSCGATFGDALGHTPVDDAAVAPTCTETGLEAGSHCSVCDAVIVAQKEVAALGHTFTFTQTFPAGELKGKTTAVCEVCDGTYESAEVGVMGKGKYVLDAADLADIAAGNFFDGEVKVVNGLFACHLSAKYETNTSAKSYDAWGEYNSTHRMNFGGQSELLTNGEGEDEVLSGGLKNFIQITTTSDTTIVIYWVSAGDGRQVAAYDVDGKVVAKGTEFSTKNSAYVTTLKVPAGTYLIGTDCSAKDAEGKPIKAGGNYFYKVEVTVHDHEFEPATCETPKTCAICGHEEGEPAGHTWTPATCETPKICSECDTEEGNALGHTWADATCTAPKTCSACGETEGNALGHTWADATCTAPKTCSACGETEGEALEHTYVDGVCSVCEAEDPDYVAPTLWDKIVAWFMSIIEKILAIFKK